ncbi:hypothetical protein GQ600_4692 [Phytophthora cactorum]|nr:hypothetical protein GQ600_4692 [Phytophthora cactorum]
MSSPCVVPVSPVAALKRARSADDDLRLLKVNKQASDASPHSPRAVAAAVLAQRQQQILQHQMQQQQAHHHEAVSPSCWPNQWERALTVLEKIERANDKISRQRRTKVREQANANADRIFDAQAIPAHPPQASKPKRSVRFSDEVQVAEAEMVDRSPAPMPMLMRDEILVLRASRPIPLRNFSEFWSAST